MVTHLCQPKVNHLAQFLVFYVAYVVRFDVPVTEIDLMEVTECLSNLVDDHLSKVDVYSFSFCYLDQIVEIHPRHILKCKVVVVLASLLTIKFNYIPVRIRAQVLKGFDLLLDFFLLLNSFLLNLR